MSYRAGMTTTRPRRAWASTATDQARQDISAVTQELLKARARVEELLEARTGTLRQHYTAGVDPRDLQRLVVEADDEISLTHVKRLVQGARD